MQWLSLLTKFGSLIINRGSSDARGHSHTLSVTSEANGC